MSGVGQRKGRHHLHGLTVLDGPEVFATATVGDDPQPILARPLSPTLAMMFVEMHAHLVGPQRRIVVPHHVFDRRVRHGPHVHVHVEMAAAFAFLVVEVDALTRRAEQVCLLYTSPSPRDISGSRMPSSA